MKQRIEHEIEQMLDCLNDTNIEVNSAFVDRVCGKIGSSRMHKGSGYGNPSLYAAVLIVMIILNITAGLMFFKDQTVNDQVGSSQVSVIAAEYGMGQSSLMSF